MQSGVEGGTFGAITNSKTFIATTLGIGLLITPIVLVYIDPTMRYAKYKFRVDNATIVHKLMQRPFHGLKLYVFLFNVTNAETFLNGTDSKIKLKEVGPFVFQEIRTNEDLVINKEPGIMRFTPKMRPVLVPEESIADPKDIHLTFPNFPLQYGTALVGKYPYLVQQLFNYVVSHTKSKPFNRLSVHEALWDREDPIIALANKMIPGLVYFKSFGLLSRLYDYEYDYHLEVGTTDSDKFAVKKSRRIKRKDKFNTVTYTEQELTLPSDTYEGAIFPPNLSPEPPINIYRPSVCRTFQFNYLTSRAMFYGGDAFVYKLNETLLNDRENCFSTGWCPGGLMNVAPCYMGLPAVVSKGHFLDADPRLRDLIEGFKPDRNVHDGELVVDPKVGVTVTASLSIQVSMFLTNMAFNPQTRRLQDIVMPTIHYILKSPPPIEEALKALEFMYKDGPRMLLSAQICCGFLGLGLLAYSGWLLYKLWLVKNRDLDSKKECLSKAPLMIHCKTDMTNYYTEVTATSEGP